MISLGRFERTSVASKILALVLIVALTGCGELRKVTREDMSPAEFQTLPGDKLEELKKTSPFLKVHMRNGNTYVLNAWEMDSARRDVTGTGTLYNAVRDSVATGYFRITPDSVALFETNVLHSNGAATALLVFTGITAAVTVFCITNPKSCFGSCPTFYAFDGDSLRLQAEGFSSSIAPSLEATDVDALYHARVDGREFEIEMRNEALETHVVRYANVLAVPRPSEHRAFADLEGRFWVASSLIPPSSATGSEGSCLASLVAADGIERYSAADSVYLGAREIVELAFEGIPDEPVGLVIACRQTLLSTYLLYQTLAYMGRDVGYWLAEIERGKVKQAQSPIQRIMGAIEVLTQDSSGDWRSVAELREQGPLATDTHLIPLTRLGGQSARIRLRMAKGNWRIDYIALAALSGRARPTRIQPFKVLKGGVPDRSALEALRDSTETLVTLPGDTYTLKYRLPADPDHYELFLESRGYYLEWIRKEWIEEENPALLAQVLLDPEAALKRMAPEFKRVEPQMESCFWRSRYAKP